MPSIDELLARLEAEVREAATRPDLVARHRDALGEVLGRLDSLTDVRLPQLSKAKRNRMMFGLDNARREIRRALDALAPRRPGRGPVPRIET